MEPRIPDADETIVRALAGHASAAQLAWLAAWLRESPEHQRRFDETRRLWRATAAMRGRMERPIAVPEHVERRLRLQRVESVQPSMARRLFGRRTIAAAAMIVVVGAGATGWGWWRGASARRATIAEYSTRDTETTTATLDDGSVVYLGPRSRLHVRRTASRRELVLHGRAYFSVAGNRGRSFIVRTANGTVRASGTRFQVLAEPSATRVDVIDGEVVVEAMGGQASVTSGRMVRAAASAIVADTVADMAPELSWMRGVLMFRDTPLRNVADEIEREYGLRVVVADAIADRTVTAWFDQQDVFEVLAVICRATFARFEARDGVARIEPARGRFDPKLRTANE